MQDAQTVAGWGMDFVKADNCNKPSNISEQEAYSNFSRALNATGRPILFSTCEWGVSNIAAWGGGVAQARGCSQHGQQQPTLMLAACIRCGEFRWITSRSGGFPTKHLAKVLVKYVPGVITP
jgi:hypothetical protein